MEGFCMNCGASLASRTGFCSACGTAVGGQAVAPPPRPTETSAGAVPPAAVYPPGGAYPAAYSAALPAKSSSGALKIVLIVVAAVVGLAALAAGAVGFVGWRMARSVHVDDKGTKTFSALGSTISAGRDVDVGPSELGVPTYPGAARGEGGMHMRLPTMSMVSAVYVTDDPVSTVAAFYRGKLGEDETDVDSATGSVLSSGKDINRSRNSTVITIAPASGSARSKTRIGIVHTVSTQ